ncbi:MAG: lysylphosphatidylglycerol synthase transmembrane domain-containing protein [Miltoncostaeaceae bacterium]
MDSLRAFLDAIEAFGVRLAAVDWLLLSAAAALGVLNLAFRARSWQGILRAALPGMRVRYRSAFGAYCGGVGVNAVIPARVGDLVKVLLVRRGVPEAPYPTLAASLLAETVFDMFVAGTLIIWALSTGALPGVRLPEIPAFDLSLALAHPWVTLAVLVVLAVATALAVGRIRRFWETFGRGLAILRQPGRYLRTVATWQAMGWGCRLGAAYLFLGAFGLPQTIANALLVLVAGSLGGLFPATPSGLGPKQALLVVVLAGEAGRTAVLAFSAGMELTIVAVNVILGLTCIALIMRSLNVRGVLRRARAQETPPPPVGGGSAAPGPD